ncbi:hypothetical protein ACFL3D_03335 [Candidatus Omnitrophota bacterium]
MKFDPKYFQKTSFSRSSIKKNLENALRDYEIACKDEFKEVKFNYAYMTLIKLGVAILSTQNMKVRSVPGHHVKLIEKIAELLKDDTIEVIGNVMRSKRNKDFYSGGIQITGKECNEYLDFIADVVKEAKKYIKKYT